MKTMLTVAVIALGMAGQTFAAKPAADPAALKPKAAAKAAAAAGGVAPAGRGKAAVAAAAARQLIVAKVVKVEDQKITVMTQPMMGPDGLIPSKEKTYDATNATTVMINAAAGKLADLIAGATVRLQITDDGKTVERVQAQIVTPADRAAKKAARQGATNLPVVPPAGQVP